jgi:hypothetical protein
LNFTTLSTPLKNEVLENTQEKKKPFKKLELGKFHKITPPKMNCLQIHQKNTTSKIEARSFKVSQSYIKKDIELHSKRNEEHTLERSCTHTTKKE